MQELAGMLRAMPSHASAHRQPVCLQIDSAQGTFRVGVRQAVPSSYVLVERTVWLPKGLRISEAPAVITALPTGGLSPADLVVMAPAYGRLFRLTTTAGGTVQVREESIL